MGSDEVRGTARAWIKTVAERKSFLGRDDVRIILADDQRHERSVRDMRKKLAAAMETAAVEEKDQVDYHILIMRGNDKALLLTLQRAICSFSEREISVKIDDDAGA